MDDAVQSRLRAPAIGLVVTGVLNAVTSVLVLLSRLLQGVTGRSRPPIADEAERLGYMTAQIAIPIVCLLGLIAAPFIIYAAVRMMAGKSHGLAMTAAILALVPCTSPCCLAGVPAGIWALVVLAKPEVKAGL